MDLRYDDFIFKASNNEKDLFLSIPAFKGLSFYSYTTIFCFHFFEYISGTFYTYF
ncbi:hypothetical protein D1BOALGB6SA_4245 [Olavius sp. associated proteobacterium Delta 1]|nr:hypothetical protein D1BOALGB6SA_4245 [Olavius sp. associated proteobacterium Delta 1]